MTSSVLLLCSFVFYFSLSQSVIDKSPAQQPRNIRSSQKMEQSNNQQTQDLSQLRARENPVVLTTAVVHEIEDDVSYEEGEKSNKSRNKKKNNHNHSTSVELEMKLGGWPDISNEVSMGSSGNNNDNSNNNSNSNNDNVITDTRSKADMEDEIRLYQAKINSLKENINYQKQQSLGKSKNDRLDEADDAIYQMSKVNQEMMNQNKSKQASNKSGININLRHNSVSLGNNTNRSSPKQFSFMRGDGNNGSNNNGNSNSSSNGNNSASRPQPSQHSNSYQSPRTQQQSYTQPQSTFTMKESGFGYSYTGIRGTNTYSMNNRFHPFDTQALHMSRSMYLHIIFLYSIRFVCIHSFRILRHIFECISLSSKYLYLKNFTLNLKTRKIEKGKYKKENIKYSYKI